MIERAGALRALERRLERLFARSTKLRSLRWLSGHQHRQARFRGPGHTIAVKVQAVHQVELRIVFQMPYMAMLDCQAGGKEEVPGLGDGRAGLDAPGSKLNSEIAQREVTLAVADHIKAYGIAVCRMAAVGASLLRRCLRNWQEASKRGRSCK